MFNRREKYNRRSSKKLGWRPSWFGVSGFGTDLTEAITAFQEAHGMKPDGMCGNKTYHLALADYESLINPLKPHIILEGHSVEVDWPKTISLTNNGSMASAPSNYRSGKVRQDPTQIITHFDAALSAASCKRILNKRGISTHFVIDNDGTIYQMVDPAYEAWHAKGANKQSIGIDISNAFYTKYNKVYKKRTHFERPVLKNLKVHGTAIDECLGFYDEQIEAYKALIQTLCKFYNIPLDYPKDASGNLVRGVDKATKKGTFSGVVCHYHISQKKIDCVNLDLDDIIDNINSERDND